MGQDNGKILRITESQVLLQEIVPDGLGGWVKREATLSVEE
jgi:type IV pilus assembly protein PilP